MSVSLVARQHGIAQNQVFTWRRLYAVDAVGGASADVHRRWCDRFDATIIATAPSTENKSEARDPDMGQIKTGLSFGISG